MLPSTASAERSTPDRAGAGEGVDARHVHGGIWYAAGRNSAVAVGLRVQRALGRRVILRLDAWGRHARATDAFGGGRSEIVLKF